jgi:hypothetical protein
MTIPLIIVVLSIFMMELITRLALAIKFRTLGKKPLLYVLKHPTGGVDWRIFNNFGNIRDRDVEGLFRFSTQAAEIGISEEKLQSIMAEANNVDRKTIIEKLSGPIGFEKSRYRPFVGFSTRPVQTLSYADIDQFGFQGNFKNIHKPKNTKRVLILGGSAAYGMGCTSTISNLANQLAKQLNDKEKSKNSETHWEIINMAFVASQSISELNQTTIYSSLFSPDIIVQLSGYNDLLLFIVKQEKAKLFTYFFQERVVDYLKSTFWIKCLEQLENYFFVIKVLHKLLSRQEQKQDGQIYSVW